MQTEPNANDQAPGAIQCDVLDAIRDELRPFDRERRAWGALYYFMAHSKAVGIGARAVFDARNEFEIFKLGEFERVRERSKSPITLCSVHIYPEDYGIDLPCCMAAAEAEVMISSPSRTPSNGGRRSGAEPHPSASSERKAAEALVGLEAHAQFLRSLGILAHVEDEGWEGGPDESEQDREFHRRIVLHAIAALPSSSGGSACEAFEALQELARSAAIPDAADSISPNGALHLPVLAGALRDAMSDAGWNLPPTSVKTPAELAALAAEWRDAGYDRAMFEATGDRWLSRVPEEIEPLVDGAIYRGKLHAFLGGASTGKSTALHELAVKLSMSLPAGAPLPMWCGLTIRPSDKLRRAHFFSGEDTRDIIGKRARAFAGAGAASTAISFPEGGADGLRRYLQGLKGKRRGEPGVPDLIVIDPALTFLEGCESDAGDVGAALGELVEIAAGTEAAVIVAHHLQKNARPSSMQEIRAMVRGSQVWIDRPRVVLGLLRTRGTTQLGVAKSNIPGVEEFAVLATLIRDPVTLMHTPAEPKAPKGTASTIPAQSVVPSAGDLDEPITAALRRLTGEGKRVTLSGKKDGLHVHAPAELAGVARDAVLAQMRVMIAAGRIVRTGDGGLEPAADDCEAPPLAAE